MDGSDDHYLFSLLHMALLSRVQQPQDPTGKLLQAVVLDNVEKFLRRWKVSLVNTVDG